MTYRATSKHKRLSILHKGLLIISIPLVFELFFVFVLVHLLDESSQHIASEIRSQDKLVAVETMIKELSDSTTSAVIYNVTRQEEFKDRNEKSRGRLRKTYSKLARLCADDPDELESVQKLYASASGWMEQQDKALTMLPQARMSAFFAMPGFDEAQRLMLMRPEGAARVILDKEQKVQTVQPKLRQQSIIRLQILILFGLAIHISITVFLANLFAKYISQRLQNVLNNTFKLGARMPLDPPLRGTDEIADLDHALHETASEILDFEKFKEQLVAVVSHELRTPLTSVQGTLTLLEAGALGEFPPKTLIEVECAQRSVKQLIDLINNLLLLERLEAGSQVVRQAELNLADIIAEVLDGNEELAKSKNIQIECNFDYLPTTGDWEKLAQAVQIIVETSMLRSPDGGRIGILADVDQTQNNIELQVVDQGVALLPVQANTYFDRERDFEDIVGGKARVLTLALCKAIIIAHEGSLSAVTEGSNTYFLLKLPMRRPMP